MNLSTPELMSLLYLVVLFLALSSWLIVNFFREPNKTSQSLFSWLLIFFGVAAAYGLWSNYEGKKLLETAVIQLNENSYQLTKSEDGHYYANILVNGTIINFLIDTGASTTTLTASDANKVGIPMLNLKYSDRVYTANGITMFANHNVKSIQWLNRELGPITLHISNSALNQSLLGMDIIEKFDRFSILGDKMLITSLKPN